MTDTHHPSIAAVAIIFNDKGEVLLTQRHQPDSYSHGMWQFPGGGVEFGEHPKDAAIREAREEAGIDIKLLAEHPFVYNYTYNKVDNNELRQIILCAYPAQYVSGEVDISGDDETSNFKWLLYKEINFEECMPLTKELIDDAISFRMK